MISEKDAIYNDLVVWIDENRDGVSQPNELHHLKDLGIISISTVADRSDKTDEHGNHFRYTAPINQVASHGTTPAQRTYDVFLVKR